MDFILQDNKNVILPDIVIYAPSPWMYGCRTVCGISSVCFISCFTHVSLPGFRWDDGPREQAVLHPHQPFSRYQTGATRRCVSAHFEILCITV